MTIFLKSKKTTLAKVTGLEYDKRIKFERERERERERGFSMCNKGPKKLILASWYI